MKSRARSSISESLAARGRGEMWVNEHEAATMCGLSITTYQEKLPDLEAAGFPRKCDINGKRFVPFIEQFWRDYLSKSHTRLSLEEAQSRERDKENWDDPPSPRRRR